MSNQNNDNLDGLSLGAVKAESNGRSGEKFTEKEKALAIKGAINVIKRRGGIPTLENGNYALGEFVKEIRELCLKVGEVPAKYKAKDEARPYASYRHMAKVAINTLKAKAEKKQAEQPSEETPAEDDTKDS